VGGPRAGEPRAATAGGCPRTTSPIRLPARSVNQRFPSGPDVIPAGLPAVGSGNSVRTPAGVIRPTRLLPYSVNQRLPSGPAVIAVGTLPGLGSGGNSWRMIEGRQRSSIASTVGRCRGRAGGGDRKRLGNGLGRRDNRFSHMVRLLCPRRGGLTVCAPDFPAWLTGALPFSAGPARKKAAANHFSRRCCSPAPRGASGRLTPRQPPRPRP
jgi:hypothetical protein